MVFAASLLILFQSKLARRHASVGLEIFAEGELLWKTEGVGYLFYGHLRFTQQHLGAVDNEKFYPSLWHLPKFLRTIAEK